MNTANTKLYGIELEVEYCVDSHGKFDHVKKVTAGSDDQDLWDLISDDAQTEIRDIVIKELESQRKPDFISIAHAQQEGF